MLPVTHRKVTIVPHSLAAIAAGVCLLVAFAWDSPRADRIADGELRTAARTVEASDSRPAGDKDGEPARETSRARNNAAEFRLFPLLMPRGSGGG